MLRRFKKYPRERGLRELWSFYSLCHRFCTVLARHEVHVEAFMLLAGHSMTTTMRSIHATSKDG